MPLPPCSKKPPSRPHLRIEGVSPPTWLIDGGGWPVATEAAIGLARRISSALERSGLEQSSPSFGGALWAGDGWRAELNLGSTRKEFDAPFDLGHHLLARLAEAAAASFGGNLSDSALRSFDDWATPSPGALLAALAGLGAGEGPSRQHWQRAFELDPSMVAPRLALAQTALATGNPASASMLLAGLRPRDEAAAAELGLALWAAGDAQVARGLLEVAAAAQPPDPVAMAGLAALLARQAVGDQSHDLLDEALLLATQASQHASDDYRAWSALADVHRARGDFAQAGFFYGFALRLAPDSPVVLKDAAAAWLLAHEPARALPLIERALVAAPADGENFGNLAFARDALGEPAAALAAARQAAALNPANPRLRILHGDLALKAGDRDEALDAWARAAELEPGIFINTEGGNIAV